ncbi:vegetative cell wall protein gp1-like [Phragmites australis]|uniref:vegetative cell wall protein gp1-like n=1 Tax=Phragmites australis TaxID=29695 RepID=UPI002D76FB2B|nr:vegetative cell wall protein gp1-like [Phragmites australis]
MPAFAVPLRRHDLLLRAPPMPVSPSPFPALLCSAPPPSSAAVRATLLVAPRRAASDPRRRAAQPDRPVHRVAGHPSPLCAPSSCKHSRRSAHVASSRPGHCRTRAAALYAALLRFPRVPPSPPVPPTLPRPATIRPASSSLNPPASSLSAGLTSPAPPPSPTPPTPPARAAQLRRVPSPVSSTAASVSSPADFYSLPGRSPSPFSPADRPPRSPPSTSLC